MIIYKITNKVNSKVYIGATTKDLNYRKQQHIYCASNTANCNKLYVAMREYGVDNFIFEKVCDVNTLDDLNVLECQYIKLYNSVEDGYNSTPGGNGMATQAGIEQQLISIRSPEVRTKISDTMKQYRKNHPFTPEQKRKFAESKYGNKNFAGHKLTEQHKEALKKSHYKKVCCIDESGKILKTFDKVKDGAYWWFYNGGPSVKTYYQLCDYIKKSSVKNIYINKIKWMYEEVVL